VFIAMGIHARKRSGSGGDSLCGIQQYEVYRGSASRINDR